MIEYLILLYTVTSSSHLFLYFRSLMPVFFIKSLHHHFTPLGIISIACLKIDMQSSIDVFLICMLQFVAVNNPYIFNIHNDFYFQNIVWTFLVLCAVTFEVRPFFATQLPIAVVVRRFFVSAYADQNHVPSLTDVRLEVCLAATARCST